MASWTPEQLEAAAGVLFPGGRPDGMTVGEVAGVARRALDAHLLLPDDPAALRRERVAGWIRDQVAGGANEYEIADALISRLTMVEKP